MKLKALGEFGLIDRISQKIKHSSRTIVGIGDDCAVLPFSKDKFLLVSTDALIENIHFKLNYCSFFQIGYKLISSGISDIAAMGGVPLQILITLGLPANTDVKDIDRFYKGILKVANKFKIDIVGGDTVSSKELVFGITVLGEVKKKQLLLRAGAKIGDLILTTGDLGSSAAGLEVLNRKKIWKPTRLPDGQGRLASGFQDIFDKVIKKHLMPDARINEAKIIAEAGFTNSMMDSSDGLATCLTEITKMSGVGAKLWLSELPILAQTKKAAEKFKIDVNDFAVYGGEDYELVFTLPKNKAQALAKKIKIKTGTSVTIIGEIVSKKHGIMLIDEFGKAGPLRSVGFEHFR